MRLQVDASVGRLSESERRLGSSATIALIQRLAIWNSAKKVLLHAPLPGELDIGPLSSLALADGKQLALLRHESDNVHYSPRLVRDLEHDLVRGPHGIREPRASCSPMPLNQLDLILVPGLAFDLRGHRLGRGKGVFDRLLATASGVRVGVAFDCQIVEAVPVEPHDARVDFVLTPTRWHEVAGGRGA